MEREYDVIYWNDLKGRLKLKFPTLTSSDLTWRHSSQEDLLEMIALKLGITYKEMLEMVDDV